MSVIQGSVLLACEPAIVFDYVTRPGTWTDWYPLTKSVSERWTKLRNRASNGVK